MRSLTERLRAFEQKKAKLADTEAKLKLAEKRSQLRRCIRIGDLAVKAGLRDLDDETLFGAMLSLARKADAERRNWRAIGAEAFAAQRLAGDREPVVLTFGTYPDPSIVADLRAGGFRFNRLLRHWEGLVRPEEAESLAQRHGGTALRVAL